MSNSDSVKCTACLEGILCPLELKRNINGNIDKIAICNTCNVFANISALTDGKKLQEEASKRVYEYTKDEIKKIEYYIEANVGILNYAINYIGKTKNKTLLEIGSARGFLLLAAKRLGFKEAIGVDLNNETFQETKRYAEVDDSVQIYRSIESINQEVDCVVMWHTLEHIENPQEYLKEISHILKNGGILYFQVPQYYQPYICSTHYYFYNEPSVHKVLNVAGYEVLEIGYDVDKQFLTTIARKIVR